MSAIREHMDSNDGFCTHCREWTAFGGVEPDATRYRCPECGRPRLYGAEECVLMGLSCAMDSDDDDDDEDRDLDE
jgi:predicted RNA-binding Zn-ribbon protein involved in translation (DUF1610 family)